MKAINRVSCVPAGRGAVSGKCPGGKCWQNAADQENFRSKTGKINNSINAEQHAWGKNIYIPICQWFILQFCRDFPFIYLWLTVICLLRFMVKTAEVIAGLCSPVSLQDEQLYRNLHEEINHLALKLEKQGKMDGKNISSRRKHINKMWT